MSDLIILAIETSCDETSIALVKNGRTILSNIIYSQIAIHQSYGGVVPEIASRKHIEKINEILTLAVEESKVTIEQINAVAVTYGPGLVGALLVGVNFAKGLAYSISKPLIGVNHIEGHICANFISNKELKPPFLTLVVSGGHTHLVKVTDYGKYEVVGKTRDDAAGEAFDKVARSIGLGYPGGPLIDQFSKRGNPKAIDFPRTFLEKDTLDFSFSGIKSAVINYQNSLSMKNIELIVEDVAASFQEAVVDVLVSKTIQAAKKYDIDTITLAGGVASNSRLRDLMSEECNILGYHFHYPPIELCTDNAAMIGCAAYYKYLNNEFSDYSLNAMPNLEFS
ncbi:MAG: tRNA (adenosine(37)-N6)-threonylcarbamoyltransferase complex transferase subunit TsaD [Tissierellales bacterium]|nr:tRNA (adenosine(37)-N6)-threonylcarbamoyltransferase complex transferase subunit TsaD [Tissierellales bacterium]MBN2828366.1 tRNA (adenosine(37)-N6)-threonylcarbamoyltransferase complex transferase subunit TsaD [Tissierellales bacterium]